jgi:hypothetical protein
VGELPSKKAAERSKKARGKGGRTSQGASFIFVLYLAIFGQKHPEGHFPRPNGKKKISGPRAAVRLRLLQVSIQKTFFLLFSSIIAKSGGEGVKNVLMPL